MLYHVPVFRVLSPIGAVRTLTTSSCTLHHYQRFPSIHGFTAPGVAHLPPTQEAAAAEFQSWRVMARRGLALPQSLGAPHSSFRATAVAQGKFTWVTVLFATRKMPSDSKPLKCCIASSPHASSSCVADALGG